MNASPVRIPFTCPDSQLVDLQALAAVALNGMWAGDGAAGQMCQLAIQIQTGIPYALLTPSGTAALELCCLLAGIERGDKVVMPSWTFASTANAVVLRGGQPIFIDVDRGTLNMSLETLRDYVLKHPQIKAIMPVHYAGVMCEMEELKTIAWMNASFQHPIIIEDAAQAYLSTYNGSPPGGYSDMAALSFHVTKNIPCGEGGAILLKSKRLAQRAEVIREKGTDRSQFLRGEIDKYTWIDVGSNYLMDEFTATILQTQLERAIYHTEHRVHLWERYHDGLEAIENLGLIQRPVVPYGCRHNGHFYWFLAHSPQLREQLLSRLKASGIGACAHFLPLHSSPAGRRFGHVFGSMTNTDAAASRIVRLPLYPTLGYRGVDRVLEAVAMALRELS